jgi:hypothetical protein
MEGIHLCLSFSWKAGYKVSQKKDQICQYIVKYLGFHLRGNRLSVPFQSPRPINILENF